MTSKDHNNRELLSSYLDGGLASREELEVLRLLAEDADAAQWVEDVSSQAADLRGLPGYTLGGDFAERVAAAAKQRLADMPVPAARERGIRRALLYSAAVIAAALLVMWVGRPDRDPVARPERPVPEDRGLAGDERSQPGRLSDGPSEFVHVVPRSEYLMVVDLVVTEKSRRGGLFEAALAQHGIRFDLDLKVEGELEKTLLESRFVQPAKPANDAEADAQPQLVYVVGQAQQIDALIDFLKSKPEHFQQVLMDLAMSKTQLEVFQHLRRMADAQLATADPEPARGSASRRIRAQKLVFPFAFRVTRFGTLAVAGGFPALLDEAVTPTPAPADRGSGARTAEAPPQPIRLNNEGDVLTNVLFVLRR